MARPDLAQLRHVLRARVVRVRVRAARREAARVGQIDEIRRPAGDRGQPALADAFALELRQRAEQRLGVRMLRMVEQLLRRRLLDDLAGVHDGDLVGRLGDDAHVVRDDDHRHLVLLAQLLEQVEDARLHRDVERRRGLVGDQQPRLARQRDRDHHALPHAARIAVRIVVEALARVRDVHLFEQLDRALPRSVAREVEMPLHRLGQLRADRQRRVERRHRVLEDHRDLPAAHVLELALGQMHEVAALERDRAARDARGLREQAHDRERRHRLAAAGLADDAERLALLDGEADAVDGVHVAAARLEVRAEVVDFEDRHLRSALGARVERVAQAVGDEERAQDEPRDRDARDDDDVRVREVLGVAVLRERAPRRVRRVDAEAEEREERLAEHDAGQLEEDEDDHEAERVRQQMPEENAMPARADRARRAHVVVLLERDDLAAHDARRREPGRDGQRDDHRPEVDGAEDRERDDRERQVRQAVEGVEDAHQPVVEPAADEARDRAVEDADHHDRDGGGEADPDRDPAAERRAQEQVAAELIGAERMRPGRRQVRDARSRRRSGRTARPTA